MVVAINGKVTINGKFYTTGPRYIKSLTSIPNSNRGRSLRECIVQRALSCNVHLLSYVKQRHTLVCFGVFLFF